MLKILVKCFLVLAISLLISNCANRGRPSGGPKDVTAPKIVKSTPENYSTNFKGKEIKIYFNEYIKINNLQKQLIVSPPMDPAPEITPIGTASKYITIKIHDTLQANTTYAFNFGNSIQDNNEQNPYTYYSYVFSTGEQLDSLAVKGEISDATLRKAEDFISVRLYEIDTTFNDSIVYNKLPKYVTNTLDSTTTFSINNIKAGKYLLVALKDVNEDNKYQQKTDKIGFYSKPITVPTDSFYKIKLFKEETNFKIIRPRLIAGEKIAFGYEGDYKNTIIEIVSKTPSKFNSIITKDAKTDTLNFWYTPKLKETDSLIFNVKNTNYSEEFTVNITEKARDTFNLEASPKGIINFNEIFKISANIPFSKFNKKKLTILDKDSAKVDYSVRLDTLHNTYSFLFNKTENNKYSIQALPEAFTDFFGSKNDTLNYSLRTKTEDDYGNVRVVLQNAKYPVIIQLTDDKGEVKQELYSSKPEPIDFKFLDPNKYFLRVIYDTNKNQKYDSGNYLKKQQPERVSYFPDALDVRAGWDLIQDFTLE